jgi:hypothetical protein
MPPKWALGFAQSRGLYTKENQALEVAAEFRKRKIPIDIIYQDIGWTQNLQDFEWRKGNYTNPKAMLKKLKDNGFKMIVSQDPVVSQKDNKQYLEANKLGYFVKDVYLYADGVNTPVASLDGEAGRFTVEFYVGEEGKLTFGAKNMTDQNYAYSANGMNWFAMDNFSLLYLGETDLSVDLYAMRKEADAIREDEVTSELWQQLVGLKESASDGIETAVRYQRVLGEIHLLQVHYEDYKDAYERYKKFVEDEGERKYPENRCGIGKNFVRPGEGEEKNFQNESRAYPERTRGGGYE